MDVTIVTGPQGSGKSLTATKLATGAYATLYSEAALQSLPAIPDTLIVEEFTPSEAMIKTLQAKSLPNLIICVDDWRGLVEVLKDFEVVRV